MAAAQARIQSNSETLDPALSMADGSPEETSLQSLSQEGSKIVADFQLDSNPEIKTQAIRANRALFPEAGSEVSPTYIEMHRTLTTHIEALLAAKMLDTATYKAYLSGMPHPTRDDGLNSRQLLQWEWAFIKALAIWLATQMAAPTKTSDDEDSLMEDSQQVSSSEGAGSSCEGSGSKASVAPQNSSHIQSGHQAIVPEVSLHSSTVDPTIQDASASGSPNMAPAAMETQATNDDESLPSGQSTPFNQVNPDSQTDQSPLTMAEVLAQGLIKDADWMKMRTVVMRVQRQKFFITVTRDQIMTDLQTMGITRDKLIGNGESGSGESEIYCLHERTALYLSEQHCSVLVRAESLPVCWEISNRTVPFGTPDLSHPSALATPLLYVCFMYHFCAMYIYVFICIYVYLFIYLFIESRGLATWWC